LLPLLLLPLLLLLLTPPPPPAPSPAPSPLDMCAKIVLGGMSRNSPVYKNMGAYKLQHRKLSGRPVYILYNLEGLSYMVRLYWIQHLAAASAGGGEGVS
jgi:hypothetical protein